MEETPKDDFGNDAIKISQLIKELSNILVEYGDLYVYSRVDYDWVTSVDYIDEVYKYKEGEHHLPHVSLYG